ncbi:MAG: hypothetical protein ACOYNL_10355 [Rickettsiales bacterium]
MSVRETLIQNNPRHPLTQQEGNRIFTNIANYNCKTRRMAADATQLGWQPFDALRFTHRRQRNETTRKWENVGLDMPFSIPSCIHLAIDN